MSGILRLESLTKGNTLKQGDKTPLKYKLFDADGDTLNVAGKPAKVRLVYPDFLTIGYEKGGLTVAQDDTVTFTIDSVIPSRIYHVEIIVDDKFIFPSRADESKFTVDKSSLGTEANIIEIIGVDAVVRKAVDLINEDPNLIIDEDKLVNDIISNTGIGSIEEYYQQFSDVITELSEEKDYHSLPEISAARGGHDTLGARLDDTTAQLAQTNNNKVDKGGSGQVKWANLAQDAREKISGNKVAVVEDDSIITSNLTDNAVKTSKIGDREVTSRKTDFIQSSTNLLNRSEIIRDKSINFAGQIVDDTRHGYSQRMDVLPNQSVFARNMVNIIWYDQNDEFISRSAVQTNNIAVAPENAYYMRANILLSRIDAPQTYDLQISLGDTEIPYEQYGLTLSDDVRVGSQKLEFDSISQEHIKDEAITPEKTTFMKASSNLFNINDVIIGKVISIDGTITDNESYGYSHPISVEPNSEVTIFGAIFTALYDQNGDFVQRVPRGGVEPYTVSIPNNVTSIRVIFTLSSMSYTRGTLQVNRGSVLLEFEEFGRTIPSEYLDISGISEISEYSDIMLDMSVDGTFHTREDYGDFTSFKKSTVDEMYVLMDNLMDDYPDYISKNLLGYEPTGLPIYLYHFKPTKPYSTFLDDIKFPKIFITGSIHGWEKAGTLSTYLMFKQMCEKWQEYPLLEAMRFNAEFLFIPVANPWGFNNNERKNSNGVDLNRNFPDGWKADTDPTSSTYSGSEPLSEIEAQLIAGVFDEHPDIDAFYDYHNYGSSELESMIWITTARKHTQQMAINHITRMTRKWKKEFDFIDQSETFFVGRTTHEPSSMVANYAYLSKSIEKSATFEQSWVWSSDPNGVAFDVNSVKAGVESITNWLLINLRELVNQ